MTSPPPRLEQHPCAPLPRPAPPTRCLQSSTGSIRLSISDCFLFSFYYSFPLPLFCCVWYLELSVCGGRGGEGGHLPSGKPLHQDCNSFTRWIYTPPPPFPTFFFFPPRVVEKSIPFRGTVKKNNGILSSIPQLWVEKEAF